MGDLDKSGSVTPGALQKYIESHPSVQRDCGIVSIPAFIQEVDLDQNGVIDRQEFVACSVHRRWDKEKCYNAIFDAIDVSGDGTLQYHEVQEFQWYSHPKIFQLLGIPDFTSMAVD